MIKIALIRQQLTPDQNRVFEEVATQYEDTVEAFNIMRKQYSGVKSRVRAIEKRLVTLLRNMPDRSLTPMTVEGNIGSIERKYIDIDKAIKYYKQEMSYFNQVLNGPHFRSFNPFHEGDWAIGNLKRHLREAYFYIERGLDALRITQRYFDHITKAFKWHADFQKRQKSQAIRRAQMEQKPPDNPSS
jgi:hypothetical protein